MDSGPRVHSADSLRVIEIKMNDLDLMKWRGTHDLILDVDLKTDGPRWLAVDDGDVASTRGDAGDNSPTQGISNALVHLTRWDLT
jgi:hypothetical protein